MTGDVVVVVPTYNEAENIEPVVAQVVGAGFYVIVVDDNSPDGTGLIADRLARRGGDITVVHRAAKAGLGPAYAAGFASAFESGAQVVGQMDADLSHDAASLRGLVEAIDRGADVAIGSRYVPGGSTVGWPLHRRMLSRGGNWYARTLLGLEVRDVTSGMRMWRRAGLMALDAGSCDSSGYGFQVEMTLRARAAGLAIREVPITFRERRRGRSKMTAGIAAEAAVQVTRWSANRLMRRGYARRS